MCKWCGDVTIIFDLLIDILSERLDLPELQKLIITGDDGISYYALIPFKSSGITLYLLKDLIIPLDRK